eukprot:1264467-Prymnesium_polylepis.1
MQQDERLRELRTVGAISAASCRGHVSVRIRARPVEVISHFCGHLGAYIHTIHAAGTSRESVSGACMSVERRNWHLVCLKLSLFIIYNPPKCSVSGAAHRDRPHDVT